MSPHPTPHRTIREYHTEAFIIKGRERWKCVGSISNCNDCLIWIITIRSLVGGFSVVVACGGEVLMCWRGRFLGACVGGVLGVGYWGFLVEGDARYGLIWFCFGIGYWWG